MRTFTTHSQTTTLCFIILLLSILLTTTAQDFHQKHLPRKLQQVSSRVTLYYEFGLPTANCSSTDVQSLDMNYLNQQWYQGLVCRRCAAINRLITCTPYPILKYQMTNRGVDVDHIQAAINTFLLKPTCILQYFREFGIVEVDLSAPDDPRLTIPPLEVRSQEYDPEAYPLLPGCEIEVGTISSEVDTSNVLSDSSDETADSALAVKASFLEPEPVYEFVPLEEPVQEDFEQNEFLTSVAEVIPYEGHVQEDFEQKEITASVTELIPVEEMSDSVLLVTPEQEQEDTQQQADGVMENDSLLVDEQNSTPVLESEEMSETGLQEATTLTPIIEGDVVTQGVDSFLDESVRGETGEVTPMSENDRADLQPQGDLIDDRDSFEQMSQLPSEKQELSKQGSVSSVGVLDQTTINDTSDITSNTNENTIDYLTNDETGDQVLNSNAVINIPLEESDNSSLDTTDDLYADSSSQLLDIVPSSEISNQDAPSTANDLNDYYSEYGYVLDAPRDFPKLESSFLGIDYFLPAAEENVNDVAYDDFPTLHSLISDANLTPQQQEQLQQEIDSLVDNNQQNDVEGIVQAFSTPASYLGYFPTINGLFDNGQMVVPGQELDSFNSSNQDQGLAENLGAQVYSESAPDLADLQVPLAQDNGYLQPQENLSSQQVDRSSLEASKQLENGRYEGYTSYIKSSSFENDNDDEDDDEDDRFAKGIWVGIGTMLGFVLLALLIVLLVVYFIKRKQNQNQFKTSN